MKDTIEFTRKTKPDSLAKLASTFFDIQHSRIMIDNRLTGCDEARYENVLAGSIVLEKEVTKLLKDEVSNYPTHRWIIAQRGLSYIMAAQLLGLTGDLSRFSNISKLWAYAGLAVVDECTECGKRYYPIPQRAEKVLHITKRLMEQFEKKKDRTEGKAFGKRAMEMLCQCRNPVIRKTIQKRKAGVLLDYNPKLKMVCFKIEDQFVKQGSFYRKLYDQFRAEYEMREDLIAEMSRKSGKAIKAKDGTDTVTKGTTHINQMARRKMVKVFLQHLWAVDRDIQGMPATKPYVIDNMGHSDYIEPPGPTAKEILAEIAAEKAKEVEEEAAAKKKLTPTPIVTGIQRALPSKKRKSSGIVRGASTIEV